VATLIKAHKNITEVWSCLWNQITFGSYRLLNYRG